MIKKIFIVSVFVLTFSFSATAFASLTFTTDSIIGTTSSTIDVGAGNTLSVQTTGNGPVTMGSGLVTMGGDSKIGGVLSIGGTDLDDTKYVNVNIAGVNGVTTYGGYFSVAGDGGTYGDNETSITGLRGIATRTSGEYTHGGIVGVQGQAIINSGISSDNMTAMVAESQNMGGDLNQSYGVFSSVLSYTATSNIDTAYGVYSDVNAISSGVIGSGRALYGRVRSSGGGSITSAYGLYLENVTAGVTDNYAIYSLGGKSYFAGNMGIGTTTPEQKLEVNGGIRLNTATAKPACGVASRGTFWSVQGGAGVKDTVEVCAKDAGDSYAWRTIY